MDLFSSSAEVWQIVAALMQPTAQRYPTGAPGRSRAELPTARHGLLFFTRSCKPHGILRHRFSGATHKLPVPLTTGVRMSSTLAYEDAIDLLDADHMIAQKQFLDY